MKQFNFPVCIAIPHMRPLHDEHHGTKACNDADSRPTLRNGVHRMYLPAPHNAQAGPEVQTGLSSYLYSDLVGALHRDAVEVLTCAHHTSMASPPSTTRPSTESSRNGPMMGRSGRRSSPVWRISRPRSTSTSVCSMAMGPTPWPKKGGWYWLLWVQTSERGEGHRHYRQPWLCVSSCSHGIRQ
jgi:hypothetical protein